MIRKVHQHKWNIFQLDWQLLKHILPFTAWKGGHITHHHWEYILVYPSPRVTRKKLS